MIQKCSSWITKLIYCLVDCLVDGWPLYHVVCIVCLVCVSPYMFPLDVRILFLCFPTPIHLLNTGWCIMISILFKIDFLVQFVSLSECSLGGAPTDFFPKRWGAHWRNIGPLDAFLMHLILYCGLPRQGNHPHNVHLPKSPWQGSKYQKQSPWWSSIATKSLGGIQKFT